MSQNIVLLCISHCIKVQLCIIKSICFLCLDLWIKLFKIKQSFLIIIFLIKSHLFQVFVAPTKTLLSNGHKTTRLRKTL